MATKTRSLPKGSKSDLKVAAEIVQATTPVQAGTTIARTDAYLMTARDRELLLSLFDLLDKRETKRRRATKKSSAKKARR